MDELDEQLRQLSLINSRLSLTDTNNTTLSDNLFDVSKLVNCKEEKNDSVEVLQVALQNRLIAGHDLNATKKVGPLVPPKPLKKSPNFPEVPQSSLVKQTCEPLYSRRLQSVDGSSNYASTEYSKEPLLLRKQHIYDTQQLTGGAGTLTRKVTLDNPAVLEQQLEALEHHKKQLEKRGKLCRNSSSNNTNKNMSQNFNHRSKLLSSSLLTDVRTKPHNVLKNSHVTYTNAMHLNNVLSGVVGDANSKNNLYCNINSTPASPINNIYSNVAYEKAQQVQECVGEPISHSKPLPSTTKPTDVKASDTDDSSIYFSHNGSIITEDEIQPPPSPVSSSYSELRHATEVFKTKNASSANVIKSSDEVILTKPIVGYEMQHGQNLSKASNESRQLYINKPYITNEVLSNNNATTVQDKANPNSSDYYGYGEFSQTSSAYESIYEPINPRPPSQMSSRSNNLAYPTCVNSGSSGVPILPECGGALGKSSSSNFSTLSGLSGISSADSNSPIYPNNTSSGVEGIINNYTENPKESEVESLTDFLVNSMDTHQDLENYGICFKCNERVVGENSGCTAMDQIYHIDCFTCSQCQINLQGKPFYALDCKPYCDFDYLQTLEKCSVCMKPILERILRATGKPYHPQCFTCVVCKKSLDGIPFTVDATNQNYCIEDFHKKFAPRCCVCKEPIMPEPGEEETVRVVALDRSFHFECYKCEDCGLLLSSEAEGRGCYPLDDHVLCKSCNAKRVQMLTNRMTTTEL